jgi:EmrB/QacA subfamily drug resistance transporter
VIAIAAAYAFISESRDTSANQRPDLAGLMTSALGLFALTYGLIEANTDGWGSTHILTAFAIAAVALATFIALELRQRMPMLDLSLFRNRTFSGANTVMLLVGLAMFGVFFYVSLYMQQVLHYSPTQAGAAFLPMTVLIILIAPLSGRFSDRVGSRPFMASGMVLVAGSLFLFSRLTAGSNFWSLLPALLLGGLGMALTMSPTTAAAMSAVRRDKAGVGSAVLNSMRQVGGSLGIAITGSIVASGEASVRRVDHVPPGTFDPVAFVHGFHNGLQVAALIALVGALVAAGTVRRPVQVTEGAPMQAVVEA